MNTVPLDNEENKENILTDFTADATNFYKKAVIQKLCQPTDNMLFIKLFYKLCAIMIVDNYLANNINNHTPIKEYEPKVPLNILTSYYKQVEISILNKLIENKELIDYLNSLTVSDVSKLCLYVDQSIFVNKKHAVDFVKIILNEETFKIWDHPDKILEYKDFTKNPLMVGNDYKETENNKYHLSCSLNNFHTFFSAKLYIDYLKETQSKFNIKEFRTIVINQDFWLDNQYYLNYVLFKLLEKYSVTEAMNCIILVIESDYRLTVDEWMDLIDNYKDYNNMPVSWIIEFVYDENS